MSKTTKFKIELIANSSSKEDISQIYEQITIFIDIISDLIEEADINTKIVNDDILPKYTGKYEQEISNSISNFKEKFYTKDNFEKHINSLPLYNDRKPSETLNYVKDYLIKNRKAKLREIIKDYKEQDLELEPCTATFYLHLKKLIESGHVSKERNIYIWNYNEE